MLLGNFGMEYGQAHALDEVTAGAFLYVLAFFLCTMSLPVKYQTPG
jgi:hypothetical protein